MKRTIKRIIDKVRPGKRPEFPGSPDYWEARYNAGGSSGSGSYNHLAVFKAEVINEFVAETGVSTVMEFGCGDGNQLTLGKYPNYIGLDVAKTAIQLCKKKFPNDLTKSFFLYDSLAFVDNVRFFKADITMSLDVIYHLIEDKVFDAYMSHLFNAAEKYVIIYSSNYDSEQTFHERNRMFTKWVEANQKNWTLLKQVKNKYPEDPANPEETSKADFFFYKKKA
jgi:hypothetical protein